jgi:Mn2+/Fe2+ NRAMP family transporter
MSGVQEICDRTALATGQGLGELASRRFDLRARVVVGVLLVALMGANALNIAADLVAIGEGMRLLHAGPSGLWAALAGVAVIVLVVRGSFDFVARMFKILCLALFAYIAVLFVITVPWGDAFAHLLVPRIEFSRGYLALVVAVLGTTISPYLFFWQSAHRIEDLREDPERGDEAVSIAELPVRKAAFKQRASRLDVFTGMTLSQIVMFAIIVSSAATLNSQGRRTVSSAAAAAKALEPIAGSASKYLFALGIIGTGFLAVPVLAGSAAAGMAGLLGRDWGFSRSMGDAPIFYSLVAFGTIGGVVLTLLHVNPISFLVVVAVINGIAAAPFLVVIMMISADRAIMGELRNGRVATALGWSTVAIMAGAALLMVTTGGL